MKQSKGRILPGVLEGIFPQRLSRLRASKWVYSGLKQQILSGGFKRGQRLIREEIAQHFSVACDPERERLSRGSDLQRAPQCIYGRRDDVLDLRPLRTLEGKQDQPVTRGRVGVSIMVEEGRYLLKTETEQPFEQGVDLKPQVKKIYYVDMDKDGKLRIFREGEKVS